VNPDTETAARLAAKLAAWGNSALSERERNLMLYLLWRHADPLDRIRAKPNILDTAEEEFVSNLEVEFRRQQ
jgi:hypothetical protein